MRIEKERLDYLDIAKAITIFLVLMGHTGASTSTFLYRRIIYSFHMPLFLLISGIVSERRTDGSGESWRAFLRKNACALLIPYFFWGILYIDFSYQGAAQVAYGSWQTITASGTVLALWYLVCLFAARVEMEGILALSGRFSVDSRLFALLAAPVAFAVGFLLPEWEPGYPWELKVSFLALGFLLIGYAGKGWLNRLAKKGFGAQLLFFLISAALFAGGILYRGDALELSLILKAKVGNLFWFFYYSFTGSAAVLGFSMLPARLFAGRAKPAWYRGILWIGCNTLGILVLHKPLLPEVVVPALVRAGLDEASILLSVLSALLTLPYTVVLTLLLKKYFPALLGLRRETQQQAERT